MTAQALKAEGRAGRNRRQEAQRQDTHARIIAAAQTVIAERTYAASTVEHILAEAGVSRAAFYSHFSGKRSVLKAMLDKLGPMTTDWYARLPAIDPQDLNGLTHWVEGLVQLFERNRALAFALTQGAVLEPAFFDMLAAQRRRLIARIAHQVPAFAHAPPIRTVVLVHQLDQFAYYAAMGKWRPHTQDAARIMAEQLQHFLTPPPLHLSGPAQSTRRTCYD